MKTCGDCGVEQTDENSRRIKSGRSAGQFYGYCRKCHSTRNTAQYHKDPLKPRKAFLKRRYGISEEQAQKLVSGEAGVCEICKGEIASCVDHDHQTGKVRGLLCPQCNGGLGMFRDSPERLEAAANYLRR